MAKKLGKALLFTAVASAAAGAAFYLLKKRETPVSSTEAEDEDLDDYDFWTEDETFSTNSESERNDQEEVAVETAPTEPVVEEAPVETAPAETAPAEPVVEEAPVETAPAEPVVEEAPVETAPAEPVVETEEFFGDDEEDDISFADDLKKASDFLESSPEDSSLNEVFLDESSKNDTDSPAE